MPVDKKIIERAFKFALRIISVCKIIVADELTKMVIKELFQAGTMIGAHLEEANATLYDEESLRRMDLALMETRETVYWLRILREFGVINIDFMNDIIAEVEQIKTLIEIAILAEKKI